MAFGATYPVSAVISAVDKFTDPMQKIAGKTLGDISRKMSSVGKGLTAGLTLPIVGFGIAAVNSAMKFDAGMANVATLIPGSKARIGELSTAVQDLSMETGKSTEDLTGGLYQVISAFGDTADTAGILGSAAMAATAGLSTTEEAINLLSAVTKGYGDTSATAVRQVSDMSLVTVKLGQTTFPELAASIGRVTPLAAELGVKQEELFGVMATATGVTGKAADVSTQLRGVLQSVLAPTEDMTNLIKGMGFESGKALLQQKGLKGTIDLVSKAATLTNTPLQKFIGSIEGQTLALALAGSLSNDYTNKLGQMQTATGATDEAYREQTQGVNAVGHAMGQLTAKVGAISERMGAALIPALTRVLEIVMPGIDLVADLATSFQTLDPTMQTIIVSVGGLAAVMGPALVVIGALIPIFAALSLPVIAAVAAVGALAVLGLTLYNNWKDIKLFFSDLWDSITGNIQANVANITQSIDSIMAKVDRFTSGVSAVGRFLGLGGSEAVPTPTSQATGVKGGQASALGSALPSQPNNQVSGQIQVKFDNAPPGTRVQQTGSNRSAVDVVTDLGTNLMQWAAGG